MVPGIFSDDCDLRDHVRRVIEMLTGGTLFSQFKADPLGTMTCIYLAVGFLLQQASGHDHDDEGNVVGADPLALELATAVGWPETKGGPLSAAVLQFVIAQLMKHLQALLDEWLDEQERNKTDR